MTVSHYLIQAFFLPDMLCHFLYHSGLLSTVVTRTQHFKCCFFNILISDIAQGPNIAKLHYRIKECDGILEVCSVYITMKYG